MATPSNQQDNDPMPKSIAIQNFVFLGNPGTGKSTLINCLVGRAIFDSGVSYGEGLTKHFQTRTHENVKYMDTPGLADRHIQESAAAAITEALKQSGNYKLFFMVRLENGRVVSDDLATIEIVLNSIELDEIPFSIIINNVKKRQYAQMMEKGADFLKVVAVINSIKHTTPHIVLIPVLSELDEEDNAVVDLPGEVESFIRFEAPVCEIPPEVVKPIKIEDFKKTSEALREAQEQLLRDNAALERRVASSRANLASFEAFLTKWKTSSTPRRAISFQMKTLLTLDSPEDILAATIRSTVNIRCQHPSIPMSQAYAIDDNQDNVGNNAVKSTVHCTEHTMESPNWNMNHNPSFGRQTDGAVAKPVHGSAKRAPHPPVVEVGAASYDKHNTSAADHTRDFLQAKERIRLLNERAENL